MYGTECEWVLKQVELFLDGELGPSVYQAVDVHLSTCGPCMRHLEFRRDLRELVRRKCTSDELPPDLLERIRSELGREQA